MPRVRALVAVVLVLAVVVVHWPREAFAAPRAALPAACCGVVAPASAPACAQGCCEDEAPAPSGPVVDADGTTSPEPCCDHGCTCGCCGGLPIEPEARPAGLASDRVERVVFARAPRVHASPRDAPDRPPR